MERKIQKEKVEVKQACWLSHFYVQDCHLLYILV